MSMMPDYDSNDVAEGRVIRGRIHDIINTFAIDVDTYPSPARDARWEFSSTDTHVFTDADEMRFEQQYNNLYAQFLNSHIFKPSVTPEQVRLFAYKANFRPVAFERMIIRKFMKIMSSNIHVYFDDGPDPDYVNSRNANAGLNMMRDEWLEKYRRCLVTEHVYGHGYERAWAPELVNAQFEVETPRLNKELLVHVYEPLTNEQEYKPDLRIDEPEYTLSTLQRNMRGIAEGGSCLTDTFLTFCMTLKTGGPEDRSQARSSSLYDINENQRVRVNRCKRFNVLMYMMYTEKKERSWDEVGAYLKTLDIDYYTSAHIFALRYVKVLMTRFISKIRGMFGGITTTTSCERASADEIRKYVKNTIMFQSMVAQPHLPYGERRPYAMQPPVKLKMVRYTPESQQNRIIMKDICIDVSKRMINEDKSRREMIERFRRLNPIPAEGAVRQATNYSFITNARPSKAPPTPELLVTADDARTSSSRASYRRHNTDDEDEEEDARTSRAPSRRRDTDGEEEDPQKRMRV